MSLLCFEILNDCIKQSKDEEKNPKRLRNHKRASIMRKTFTEYEIFQGKRYSN